MTTPTYQIPLHLQEWSKKVGYEEIIKIKSKQLNFWRWLAVISWIITAIVVYLWLFIPDLGAAEVSPPDNLWKGIIAEAVSEGYDGMYAVCCVYKNRLEKNMSLGCVALKRRNLDEFVRREGKQVEYIAKDIIKKVFEEKGIDSTREATHYENIKAFGMPKWAYSMVRTVKIKSHTFWKAK